MNNMCVPVNISNSTCTHLMGKPKNGIYTICGLTYDCDMPCGKIICARGHADDEKGTYPQDYLPYGVNPCNIRIAKETK